MPFYLDWISWIPGLLIFTLTIVLLKSSIRVIDEGTQALVEKMGKYSRTLDSGIKFIFPIVEYIALRDSVREQKIEIPPIGARTKDGIYAEICLAIIWQIKDLRKTYYAVESVEACLSEIVEHTVANKISLLDKEEIRPCEFDYLKEEINDIVEKWGIAVTHLFFHGLGLPVDIIRAEVARGVQDIQKNAEDVGIKTPENEMVFESLLKDLEQKVVDAISLPRYDLRGANFGGGFAHAVQGSQLGVAVNGDNQVSCDPSSQLSSSDLQDRGVD